jgi:hypothetical protein
MSETAFYEGTAETVSFNTNRVKALKPNYSIGAVMTGTYNADVKLQSSMDGLNWVDITGTESAAITGNPEVVQWDISVGMHKFVRVAVAINSGSLDINCYMSNGAW